MLRIQTRFYACVFSSLDEKNHQYFSVKARRGATRGSLPLIRQEGLYTDTQQERSGGFTDVAIPVAVGRKWRNWYSYHHLVLICTQNTPPHTESTRRVQTNRKHSLRPYLTAKSRPSLISDTQVNISYLEFVVMNEALVKFNELQWHPHIRDVKRPP